MLKGVRWQLREAVAELEVPSSSSCITLFSLELSDTNVSEP